MRIMSRQRCKKCCSLYAIHVVDGVVEHSCSNLECPSHLEPLGIETAAKIIGVIGAIAGGIALGSLIFNQDLTSKLPKIAGTLVGGLTFAGVLEFARRKQETSTTAEVEKPDEWDNLAWMCKQIPTIATSPICQSCKVWVEGRCRMHHKSPTEDSFGCIDFEPRRPAEPIACHFYKPLYPQRRIVSEMELRESLQQPIRVSLLTSWIGSRDVWIYAPWSDRTDDLAYDICLGETPRWENHEGGIRMACTGHEDYYCNVGASEAAVFAWEVSLAAAIAESQESFERFWADPQTFIAELPNPNGYKVEVN